MLDFINRCGGQLPEPLAAHYFRQLVDALGAMHASGVVRPPAPRAPHAPFCSFPRRLPACRRAGLLVCAAARGLLEQRRWLWC